MSSNCRTEGSKLARRYAATFKIPIEDVEIAERPDDEVIVFSKKDKYLPRWSTGECR
jgi:hypothetical protein